MPKTLTAHQRRVGVRNSVWKAERPILAETVRRKGYKTNPFPPGSAPPHGNYKIKHLLHMLQNVDFKKAVPGYQRAYNKKYMHNRPIEKGVSPRTGKSRSKKFANPIQVKSVQVHFHRAPRAKRVRKIARAPHQAREEDITYPEV
jgi:hypothetical protein